MLSKSSKENIEPGKKLPPLGNKYLIPKIHLDKLKNQESPLKSYQDSFISINIHSSKSPSSYRELSYKSTETLVENTGISRNLLCSGCSIGNSECNLF